jgi:S-adenosylmethionine hydrolase
MIALLTDFGSGGPYVGEMLAVLARESPTHPSINLMSDLPRWRPREAAYLIAPLVARQPPGTLFVTVLDPGVGTEARKPVWLQADEHLLVGPDNGLLDVVARQARNARMHEILWRPRILSTSFHGRDLFAPVAAMLAAGQSPPSKPLRRRFQWSREWPEALDRIIYIDDFGNCMTGRCASSLNRRCSVGIAGREISYARTFAEAEPGTLFWYENSLGLVEVAANKANASQILSVEVGDEVTTSS